MHEQWTVADLEIQKGGSATGAQSAPENCWVATPTSGHVNAFMTHIIIVTTDWQLASELFKIA